jgi:putative GTP pyrophosphokinase
MTVSESYQDRSSKSELASWYRSRVAVYEGLTEDVRRCLEKLLQDHCIDFLSAEGRTKSEISFLEKARRKVYTEPEEQIHDISGIRVITFVESDSERVVDLIDTAFHVHQDKSPDKNAELGVDRIGYRSRHFVCDLGLQRLQLAEYRKYDGLLFEIQVRTVLQHAWAEIEHDRGYKLGGVLPPDLARRLNLAAGLLEVADQEFDYLAGAIDEYRSKVAEDTSRGHLDIDLNSPSLSEYLQSWRESAPQGFTLRLEDKPDTMAEVVDELRDFGATTLKDVDQLLSPEFITSEIEAGVTGTNQFGLLRDAMMFKDIERYFAEAWKDHWRAIDPESYAWLEQCHGFKLVGRVVEEYGLSPEYDVF